MGDLSNCIGRDALVGVVLLTLLAGLKGLPNCGPLSAYHIQRTRSNGRPDIDVNKVLWQMKAKYAGEQVTDIDGVKIDFPAEWVHLRKSNTEPIIAFTAKAATRRQPMHSPKIINPCNRGYNKPPSQIQRRLPAQQEAFVLTNN